MKRPILSVIIPIYNSHKTIEKICNQILDNNLNIELILVNDGSTDNSFDICNNIAKKDPRAKVINQENSGPSSARNNGILNANGEFITFCDSDDEINSKNFAHIIESLPIRSDMLVLGWTIKQNTKKQTSTRVVNLKNQEIKSDEIISKMIKSIADDGRMYNLWNKIYKTDIIHKNNLKLREDLRFGEDLIFNFEFIKKSNNILISNLHHYYIYTEDSPTSIVSSTKLNYDYRTKNLHALDGLVKCTEKISDSEMANFVKWRWMVSYCLAICNSGYNQKEKIKLIISAIKDQELKIENSSRVLSKKQFIMEIILYILTKIPYGLFISMNLSLKFKKRQRPEFIKITLNEI